MQERHVMMTRREAVIRLLVFAPGEVLIIAIIAGVGHWGRSWRGSAGGSTTVVGGRGRHLDSVRCAQHLANIEVRARGVNLRVVQGEDGGVDGLGGCDAVACVVCLDDVGRVAVLSRVAEADGVAWHQVRAGGVNYASVHDGELVGRDVIGSRDGIADVTLLDGVRAGTISGKRGLGEDGEGHDGNNDGASEHGKNR